MLLQKLTLLILFQAWAILAQSPVRVTDHALNITYIGSGFSGIESFQGIRFGQDTSGANRFRHPKPFAPPSGTTVDATKAGPACPQNTVQTFLGITQNETVTLSEDCLNLLVVRAGGTKQDAGLPVMVWIYGGGDETGAANVSLWDPTKLVLGAAAKGTPVVYVAMNYRVNVFGFANSPALRAEHSLNSGLLDQRLALDWIQKHISTFGGNPKKVTIFGQSDGATGAGLHLTAYGGKGTVPFKRAIFESGGPAGDPGVSGEGTINSTATVAQLAGCTGEKSAQVLSCLRKLSSQDLIAAVVKFENITTGRSFQDIFYPTIDGDYIPAPPTTLLREGRFHKNVSVIAGWTFNDGNIFCDPTLNSSQGVDTYLQLAYPHLNKTNRDTLTTQLYPLSDFIPTAEAVTASPYFLQASQIYRDINFACPAVDVTHHVSQYGSPSYLYDLNTTSYTFLLTIANATFEGVIHTSDILFVFNNPTLGGLLPITAAQKVTQARMSGSWARFAATGNPSGPADTSLAGWNVAYSKIQATTQSQAVKGASLRVIGGPNAGQHSLTMGGTGGTVESKLLQRCALINSLAVQAQVQT